MAVAAGAVGSGVGLGVGLIAQERGLRQAAARVAAKFDLILAAPGDEIAMLMATVLSFFSLSAVLWAVNTYIL